MNRVFVSADWRNVEGRLTALFSGDAVLRQELDAELVGGPKVHSLNAAMLYGCDPKDAKTFMVNLKGQMRPAYEGGKRTSHAFNYGMGAVQLGRTFWIPRAQAEVHLAKLSAKYEGVVAYRRTLANEVFGEARHKCPRCGFIDGDEGDCPTCSVSVGVPIPLRFDGYVVPPSRQYQTVFGRRRLYPGRRREGANALAAQPPQSSGASMWNITFTRLHGWDPIEGVPWPSPKGILRYDPARPWADLFQAAEIFVAMGTYDSYNLEAPTERRMEVLRWLLWTMEQPFAELSGWRFPSEGSVGGNLGKYDAVKNPAGLRELNGIEPFTAQREAAWM